MTLRELGYDGSRSRRRSGRAPRRHRGVARGPLRLAIGCAPASTARCTTSSRSAGVFALRADGFAWADAVVVFEQLGRHCVPGPLVACLLAGDGIAGIVERDARADAVWVEDLDQLDVLYVIDGDAVTRVDPRALVADPRRGRSIRSRRSRGSTGCPPAPRPTSTAPSGGARARCSPPRSSSGLADRCTELAVAYAKERVQFDRAIASFQAIKHICADMVTRTEVARAAVYAAGAHLDAPEPLADSTALDRSVATAKLLAGEAAIANGKAATQVHGGMGFTWEVDVHLFLKRAWVLETRFGSGDHHADASRHRCRRPDGPGPDRSDRGSARPEIRLRSGRGPVDTRSVRACHNCGYLVPDAWDTCKRCHAALKDRVPAGAGARRATPYSPLTAPKPAAPKSRRRPPAPRAGRDRTRRTPADRRPPDAGPAHRRCPRRRRPRRPATTRASRRRCGSASPTGSRRPRRRPDIAQAASAVRTVEARRGRRCGGGSPRTGRGSSSPRSCSRSCSAAGASSTRACTRRRPRCTAYIHGGGEAYKPLGQGFTARLPVLPSESVQTVTVNGSVVTMHLALDPATGVGSGHRHHRPARAAAAGPGRGRDAQRVRVRQQRGVRAAREAGSGVARGLARDGRGDHPARRPPAASRASWS